MENGLGFGVEKRPKIVVRFSVMLCKFDSGARESGQEPSPLFGPEVVVTFPAWSVYWNMASRSSPLSGPEFVTIFRHPCVTFSCM